MSQGIEEFREKFRVDTFALHRNDGWTLSLRPKAVTLGACVLSANRPIATLAALDPAEAADLVAMIAWFEAAARRLFAAEKFNYLALMMVDAHVHFHALPRYSGPRTLADRSWTDPGWPGQPDLSHGIDADAPLHEVMTVMRSDAIGVFQGEQ